VEERRFSAALRSHLSGASAPVAPLGLKAHLRWHENAALEGPLFHGERGWRKQRQPRGDSRPGCPAEQSSAVVHATGQNTRRAALDPTAGGGCLHVACVAENHQLRLNSANRLLALLKGSFSIRNMLMENDLFRHRAAMFGMAHALSFMREFFSREVGP
jgi:hypothetical protein